MKKEKKLEYLIKELAISLEKVTNNQKNSNEILGKIINLIEFILKSIFIIFFVLNFLVWRLLLWDLFNNFLYLISKSWPLLSTNFRTFIITVVGGLFSIFFAWILKITFYSLLPKRTKKLILK